MNSKTLKNNKKQDISTKAIIFWGFIGVLVLCLIVAFIVSVVRSNGVHSYRRLLENDSLVAQEVYEQKEESYLVLVYDFANQAGTKDMKTFDNSVFTYLTYLHTTNNKNALKMYALDMAQVSNQLCLGEDNNLLNTTRFAKPANPNMPYDQTKVLSINKNDYPIVLLMKKDGEETIVSKYYLGETAILEYLNELKK